MSLTQVPLACVINRDNCVRVCHRELPSLAWPPSVRDQGRLNISLLGVLSVMYQAKYRAVVHTHTA